MAERRLAWRGAMLVIAFLAAAVGLQILNGGYASEFGRSGDEAAHYITGLMVHDYVTTGLGEDPFGYAINYYEHYPKIGLGHWPPGYYLAEAAWMFLFSAGRVSILLMQAALAVLLSFCVSMLAARDLPSRAALAVGALVLFNSWVQSLACLVMSDLLSLSFVVLAVWSYVRYMEREDWLSSLAFGLFAAAALLTKGIAMILAPLPVLAVLLAGRFRLFLRLSFWMPAVIVLAIAGPWYAWSPMTRHETVLGHGVLRASPASSAIVPAAFLALGVPLLLLAAAGLYNKVILPFLRRKPLAGIWSAVVGILISYWLAVVFVAPARAERQAVCVMPFVILLAVAGGDWLLRLRPLVSLLARWKIAAVLLCMAGLLIDQQSRVSPKAVFGFQPAAEQLAGARGPAGEAILISSDSYGEGMFITELAMREKRPGHRVLRGSKLLSTGDWMGRRSRLLFTSEEEMGKYLTNLPLTHLVVDTDPLFPLPHHKMLVAVLRANPDQWQLTGEYPQQRFQGDRRGGIEVYRRVGGDGDSSIPIPSQLRLEIAGQLGDGD